MHAPGAYRIFGSFSVLIHDSFLLKTVFHKRCFVLIVFRVCLIDLSHQALKELINLEMQNVTWIHFLRLRYVNEVLKDRNSRMTC